MAGNTLEYETAISGSRKQPQPAEFTPAEIRRNITAIILLDSIYSTGWAELFLALSPLWVFVGASNRTIGLINSLTFIGLFGMVISPWITTHLRTKKLYLFLIQIPFHLPLAIAGLGIIFHAQLGLTFDKAVLFSCSPLLLFVISMIVVHQFFGGFVGLPHSEYIAGCIPMSHRGRYTGLSGSIGAATALASTAIGGVILDRMGKPACFGFLMLLTALVCQGGYFIALLAKEKPVPVENAPKPWSKRMLSAAWSDRRFIRVLVLRGLGQLTFLPAGSFVLYYGLKDLKMAAATVATGAMLGQITRICTSAPSGWLIDRLGAKRVWTLAPLGMAIAYLALLLIPPQLSLNFPGVLGKIGLFSGPIVIYLYGALRTGLCTSTWMASGVLLYGLPRPEHRPGYYTIQLLSDSLVPAVGALLMGWMFDMVNYRTGFWIALGMCLVIHPLMEWLLKPLSNDSSEYA